MASVKSASKPKKKATAAIKAEERPARLADYLLARAPAEDIAPYDVADLERAADLAGQAVATHRKGECVVAVDADSGVVRDGRPMTVVTVVNDNMPFLFDSILGEITETSGEPTLVTHPVIVVRHGKGGVEEILGDGNFAKDDGSHDRLSVIHVHIPRVTSEQASGLSERLRKILGQVHAAVHDWRPMLARLDQAISEFRYTAVPLDKKSVAEALAFLEWLRDDNFTFLGMREFKYTGGEESGTLERAEKPGLGILSDPDVLVLRRGTEAVTTTPEIRAFLHGPEPLIVTKANAKSSVHRRIYLDYIGIKTYTAKGTLAGELRIVGLFTSTAYTRSVMKIPYLRSKAETIIAKSGFDRHDHSGKALINVLESYPRDELFQVPVPILRKHAAAILGLVERPRVRALVRADQFDRFVSILVFVPRDRYDSVVREKIGSYLKTVFEGRLSAYYPAFPEGGLARVHFIIGRSGGKTPKVEQATIEAAIRDIVRTWEDALSDAAEASGGDQALKAIAARLPESYRDSFSAAVALADARRIAKISAGNPIAIDYYRHAEQKPHQASLKIYHHGSPVALSRRVPVLENIGFRVISERTFEVGDEQSGLVFIHDMELENSYGKPIDLTDGGGLFEDAFLSVWRGDVDNDGYNGLAQTAGLWSGEITILRAYGRYLQQVGIPQSQDFIAAALNRYPDIARGLHALFIARLGPTAETEGVVAAKHLKAKIKDALEDVPNIDDDTIIRRYLNLIEASLRTNHFVADTKEKGQSLAIKLDSHAVEGLPAPRPWREIFVYGSEVEGLHLRFGPVARGGLRWSDRAQDYRTEVLGLVKAQQVKNAVIVPVGAKGGFYPKKLPMSAGRDAIFEAGTSAYKNFVSSLLSITDNIGLDGVIPPAGVIRRDPDDPYFVVAADKGTATFSDTANAISEKHGFWLDDAFASGGSAGYDHKKMGITAKGAWEAVKRHFREINRDIQTSSFTVVGVGDMSGDVFGNGMLLSPKTRLIAAFDHRDIFIDPDPDMAASMAERERMFALPRSSWQDYDKTKLSEGGIIVSRNQKSITLPAAAAAAIGLAKTAATPVEIMTAILKAPVDLLWFGGIGTYLRASTETNAEVGDRANDAIRITALDVRAKVIGEGANLGVTQRARIEFGLNGGRCNSDAIDNSGGVNCSDVEVNIKIALASAMRKGSLTRPARNKLLAEMTDEVGSLVLSNNYQQTLALSIARKRGLADIAHQSRFMTALEARGLLDRTVETLPSPSALAEREARGEPLTRAELGVLLAYAKIVLFSDIVASDVPDDAHFDRDLMGYFPDRMAKKYATEIHGHRLRREIITRVVANDLVNRGGPSFVNRLQEATGRTAADVVRTFAMVRDGFALPALYREIDALDNQIDGQVQLDLYQMVSRLIYVTSGWYLKNDAGTAPLGQRIAELQEARKALEPKLVALLPAFSRERIEEKRHGLFKSGAPEGLAGQLALSEVAELIPDIALTARTAGADIVAAAKAFFAVSDAFRIPRVEDAARSITPSDYYDQLALSRATDTIGAARRGIAVAALTGHAKTADPVVAWLDAGGERVARIRERLQALTEGGDITVSRLSVASGLMSDLTGM
ncbi:MULTISPECIES: NAD-glutamate dehydrogenase [Mesorhizobium]|uniref:NAD-glutamate dehydrogenase n=7 Tax=Phyllobacteriaceae TaxID=69277 RepID=UPI000FCBBE5E|nr:MULTISPECIES: NAD-glutamate dehydrogenase [Mesorhizobium]MCF6123313.1 NAD-glutamate dehydrogenase [Mesorhizobium ciceri]MCQ8815265.1 NAD-glutamate dehydrogenase [Mesorhizobium sp. SEMIA396]RUX81088.1 NAD-glutamate dehydrogenase [Mesorhizobium sp. M7A.F.Ca.CA.004.08.2.1]RUY53092.1 NAD-glutamate dehydrogenase [Mesorhizobium sp. M7A.F.Ca.CA.001.12.1.1]RUZ54507.1 NAD-glutamate dehydrogenase [Mesorhizobium sp. M7A.F.Ca.CA.004.05.2.1]